MPAIDKVPYEVWARIANHASPRDRKALSATCRVLHHASRDPIEPRFQEARAILQAEPIKMAPDQVDALVKGVRRKAKASNQRVHGDKLVNACKQQRPQAERANERAWRENLRILGPHAGYHRRFIGVRRPVPAAESAALFGLGLVSIGLTALNLVSSPCLGYVIELGLYGVAAACRQSSLTAPAWMDSRFKTTANMLFAKSDLAIAGGVVGLFACTFLAFCLNSAIAVPLMHVVFMLRAIALAGQGTVRLCLGGASMVMAMAERFSPRQTFVDVIVGPNQRVCSEKQLAEIFLFGFLRRKVAHDVLLRITTQRLGYSPVAMASRVQSVEPPPQARTWMADLRPVKWFRFLAPKQGLPMGKRL